MNAERLHAIVNALKAEGDAKNLVGLMQSLVQGLRTVVQQSNASTQQNLSSYINSMYAALTDSEVDRFSPAWTQILNEMGGGDLFGGALKQKIEGIIARNQMTPSVAADELDEIRTRMERFNNALTQASSSFSVLKIGDEKLAPGECEIGMLIPRDAVHNRLIDFAKELKDLSFILNTFSEVATGHTDDLRIKTISSSDLLVYLQAHPTYAACLAVAVERVVALYKQLLEIRKIQVDLQKQGVPDERTKGIEDHANQLMDSGIEKVSVEIVREFHKGQDNGRKNELITAVRVSLNGIANRIDRGYNFEVRCASLPSADADEEAKKAIASVQAASANMQFLKLEGSPILKLPEKKEEIEKNKEKETGKKEVVKKRAVKKETPQEAKGD